MEFNVKQLQDLVAEAEDRKTKDKQEQRESEQQRLDQQAKAAFDKLIPRLIPALQIIAGKGNHSCAIEIPRNTYSGMLDSPPLDAGKLVSIGKLLFDWCLEQNLESTIHKVIYDGDSWSGGATWVPYIEIIWQQPAETSKDFDPFMPDLTRTTPLICWNNFNFGSNDSLEIGEIKVTYPDPLLLPKSK